MKIKKYIISLYAVESHIIVVIIMSEIFLMNGQYKKIILFLMTLISTYVIVLSLIVPSERGTVVLKTKENYAKEVKQDVINVESKSAVLLEATTGKVLYEKKANEQMPPASITKIMTLLLIFDALDEGKINLEDEVKVSEHAASMGGSQVYLEVNETQTVNDMIKCISIASANDACVAMAEYIAGSEEAFVKKMNDKAADLGMKNTKFMNCCGLDVKGHYSCAADIAIMGRELITKYPQISEYATTWMDKITHRTKKGEKEFGLTNTNKLVRTYDGITGLKTGSTDDAGYCLCASSTRNDMSMIAVVMSAKDHKSRFSECASLMDYGYGICKIYHDKPDEDELSDITVKGSVEKKISAKANDFSYILTGEESADNIEREIIFNNDITAPVERGDKVGEIKYKIGSQKIGSADIISTCSIDRATYSDYVRILFYKMFGI